MKKLMIGLVGAAAMVACAEVASDNIVGFNQNGLVDSANFVAAMFDDVGKEGIDIQNIIPKGDDLYSGGVTLKLLKSDLSDDVEYCYLTVEDGPEGAGWYYDDWETLVDHVFEPGDGFIMVNGVDGATRSIAGQVPVGKPTFELFDSANHAGNVTPIDLDIQDIKLGTAVDENGALTDVNEEIYSGAVTLKLLNSDLSDDVEFCYLTALDGPEGAGWYNDDWETLVDRTFSPGEGFFLVSGLDTAWAQIPAAVTK